METSDTAKEFPTDRRASSRPYQLHFLWQFTVGMLMQRAFDELNQRYWSGRIPQYKVRVVKRIDASEPSGLIQRRDRTIWIRRDEHQVMVQYLVHEMCHAATNDYHGPKFQTEIRRLHNLGAPVADEDLDWSKAIAINHITREQAENAAMDIFADNPELRLDTAFRLYATSIGLTAKGLQHSHPWIRGSFRKAKSQANPEITPIVEKRVTYPVAPRRFGFFSLLFSLVCSGRPR
jgi:hypothetical protein